MGQSLIATTQQQFVPFFWVGLKERKVVWEKLPRFFKDFKFFIKYSDMEVDELSGWRDCGQRKLQPWPRPFSSKS